MRVISYIRKFHFTNSNERSIFSELRLSAFTQNRRICEYLRIFHLFVYFLYFSLNLNFKCTQRKDAISYGKITFSGLRFLTKSGTKRTFENSWIFHLFIHTCIHLNWSNMRFSHLNRANRNEKSIFTKLLFITKISNKRTCDKLRILPLFAHFHTCKSKFTQFTFTGK